MYHETFFLNESGRRGADYIKIKKPRLGSTTKLQHNEMTTQLKRPKQPKQRDPNLPKLLRNSQPSDTHHTDSNHCQNTPQDFGTHTAIINKKIDKIVKEQNEI